MSNARSAMILNLGLFGLATLVASVGCAPATVVTEKEAESSSKIIGGTADSGDSAVVAVVSQDATQASLCTGEVIAPTIILTASHCVSAAVLGFTPTQIMVVTASDVTPFFTGGGDTSQIVNAVRATTHPSYDPTSGANDVAIIELASAINVTPLPINRDGGIDKLEGSTGRAIGYGRTVDSDTNSAGKKNQASLTLSKFTPTTFLAASLPATQCHGDSGGPVLATINGQETIIGIGWQTVLQDGSCAQGVMDTRVDPYVSFIDSFLGAAAGGGNGADGADGADGANGNSDNGGDNNNQSQSQITCCVNGDSFSCPDTASCLGGFDLNGCINACKTSDCIVACSNQLTGKTPTNACTKVGSCN